MGMPANAGSGMVLGHESDLFQQVLCPTLGWVKYVSYFSTCCRPPSDFIKDRWWSSHSICKRNASLVVAAVILSRPTMR